MPRDDDQSLGDQQTYEGGAQPADSSDRSLGDQSTFGGGGESSLSDIGGLTGDADLDMEIVDLSRYEVQETLGKGGMGEVLLATDTRLNRKVAIKRMLGDGAKSQTAVKRFLTEAQSIAALNHFNIVQIHDYGRDKDGPFLIMEYVGGGSLLDKCREGALPLEEAVELTCQLCDGLSKAHNAGIIHRDIKPANVLLTTDGLPKLTDFGLARQDAGDTGQTVTGAVLGTLDFMPPEQRKDATQTDARSDLWSLAVTLYQMMTGKSPKVIKLNDVPQSLQDVLGKALEDEQDDRYQTAREFKDALRASLQAGGAGAVLGDGECPQCRTRNDSSRKFCRGCGGSLEAACLSCASTIPMWEEFCGGCGAKQSDLLDERRSQMASDQSESESLLKGYDFDGATKLASVIRDESDPRLQHLKDWAETFLPQIEQERQRQLERIPELLSKALRHASRHDYESGVQTLNQVPKTLRSHSLPGQSQTVSSLLSQLREKQSQVQHLDRSIRARVKSRQLSGLLTEVDALLALKPNREDIKTLKQQLIERDVKAVATIQAAFTEGQKLFAAQDYEGCLQELDKIPRSAMNEECSTLRFQAETNRDRVLSLQRTITAAVTEKRLSGLLEDVDRFLELQSHDEDMLSLKQRLVAREDRIRSGREETTKRARELIGQCDFVSALETLQRIRQEYQTQEIGELLADCDTLQQQRTQALLSLEQATLAGSFARGLAGAQTWLKALKRRNLDDGDFVLRYESCEEALRNHEVASEDADRRRALQKKVTIGVLTVLAIVAVVCLYSFATQYAASQRAAAQLLAEAQQAEAQRAEAQQAEALRIAAQRAEAARIAAQERILAEQQAEMARIAERERILAEPLTNTLGMAFRSIPAGTFTMGEGSEAHQVTLTNAFNLGVYEVTQEQYEAVMGTNPSKFEGPQNSVEQVSWDEAVEFCRRLSELPAEKSEGYTYRLPTEAEWEYACRAGTKTEYSFGDSASELGAYAWYDENSGKTTHPVGGKQANPWGLYYMHGNVWEWCQDWYAGDYPSGSVTDPTGAASGSDRVCRGGSWDFISGFCRSAFRFWYSPGLRFYFLGFRVLRSSIQ